VILPARDALKITIIGTGYVGLTTGLSLAYLGHSVTCVDRNSEIVERLKAGQVTIHEPGLAELLAETRGRVSFCTELEGTGEADIFIIAVGTPAKDNGDADLSYVESAAGDIGNVLLGGSPVIVNKSTVPIGSARRVEAVIRSRLEKRGVRSDFVVASNPEFLREGAALHDTFYPDRIVVGANDVRALNAVRQMYGAILEQTFTPPRVLPRPTGNELPVLVTTSPASAELIKYAANSYLAMKISFANEFAGLAERVGADIREVARGIGLDRRIGPGFLAAGAGWGGSCFPKDTRAILYTGSQYAYQMPLVEAAVMVNRRQRKCIVEKLQSVLKVIRGNTIGVLGLSFKPDTDDMRESPALEVVQLLLEMGARVRAYDPVAMDNCRKQYPALEIEYAGSAEEMAAGCDAIALLTDWKQFAYVNWKGIAGKMRRKIIVDGRNMLDRDMLEQEGFIYIGVGR
jgi:UDPglucose 6-dehydrogenase